MTIDEGGEGPRPVDTGQDLWSVIPPLLLIPPNRSRRLPPRAITGPLWRC
jgi:hypothetical protein